jgi:hypothetical protein
MEEEQPDAATLARFADLSLVVHQLKLLTHERFYTRSADSSAPPRTLGI